MTSTSRSIFATASLLASLSACVAGVRGAYGVGYYDTQRCYWTWVDDPYGGYDQLYCYNGSYGGYYPYLQGGVNVRRYPGWYSGRRTIVAPPSVGFVRPPGVTIVPTPSGPRVPMAVPVQPVPQAVPVR